MVKFKFVICFLLVCCLGLTSCQKDENEKPNPPTEKSETCAPVECNDDNTFDILNSCTAQNCRCQMTISWTPIYVSQGANFVFRFENGTCGFNLPDPEQAGSICLRYNNTGDFTFKLQELQGCFSAALDVTVCGGCTGGTETFTLDNCNDTYEFSTPITSCEGQSGGSS